jgi:hypothetical protein
MAPMQWAALKDIDDINPLNESDYECLAEIREVLKRHGKAERLGVALLHKHFDMAGDEVLVESSDKEDRVLTIKPVKQDEASNTVGTIWQLIDGECHSMSRCHLACSKEMFGGHIKYHKKY